jgi:hypothetical protein
MAREVEDHKVITFTGGRGSGKSLSMSTEGAINLMRGFNVWANYPLSFSFRRPSGYAKHYEAQEITIKDIATFNEDIRNGYILFDELNLWLSSRRSQALINHLANGWFQLLRKRKLAVYITCQFFHTLDKGLREQTDLITECFDLHYKYPSLKKGQCISQLITSYSGYGTGRPLYKMDDTYQWKRNTRARILHGSTFWRVYDSWSEYDILKALTKYEVQRDTIVINGKEEADVRTNELTQKAIFEMTQLISDVKGQSAKYTSAEMQEQLKEWGIPNSLLSAGTYLKKAGWKYDGRGAYKLQKSPKELEEVNA